MVSIIIVHYKVKKELFCCIESLRQAPTKTAGRQGKQSIPYEVIVVDNDEEKTIENELKKKFPWVKYIKAPGNIGFGAGNNLGAQDARGEYLFFLNPDTEIFPGTIDKLISFLKTHKKVGIVAPLLLDTKGRPYPLQGSAPLTPLSGMVALSALNALFPKNPISRRYWLFDWNRRHVREVAVVPGTALMIPKDVFEKVGRFDEKFFLYFEESDLCKRVKEAGFKVFMVPKAQVVHTWGVSTKKIDQKLNNKFFTQSRFRYFRKHYGLFSAFLVHFITSFSAYHFLLFLILAISTFLNFYRLKDLMMFIGDFGWFYLSARDLIIDGKIPLVGITTSVTWLHQGALWTYILAPILWVGKFHPVSGAYFTAFLGILSVFFIYKLGEMFFDRKIGLLSSFFYATSPLVIAHARMPYLTAPIPFFTIFFLIAIFKYLKGDNRFLPLAFFLLGILYNLELSNIILIFLAVALILLFKPFLNKKLIVASAFAFLIPLLPILYYDATHGFGQTAGLAAWVLYRIFAFFGVGGEHAVSLDKLGTMTSYFWNYWQRLVFPADGIVALLLLFLIFAIFWRSYRKYGFGKKNIGLTISFLLIVISVFSIVVRQAPSEAYLPILFPVVALSFGLLANLVLQGKAIRFAVVGMALLIGSFNSFYILESKYFLPKWYGPPLSERVAKVKEVIKETQGRAYFLKGEGPGSEFQSFTMNYEYLAWWLGNTPSSKPESLRFVISEKGGKIEIKKISN